MATKETEWGWSQLEELLQCPVCYDLPKGNILVCDQGHHICEKCRQRIAKCPLCKSMFYGTRNYVMEELLTNISTLKLIMTSVDNVNTDENYSTDTTSKDATPSSSSSSADNNDSTGEIVVPAERPQAAPTSVLTATAQSKGNYPCRVIGCGQSLPVGRMINHVRYFHADQLVEGKLNDNQSFSHVLEFNYELNKTVAYPVRIPRMGLFYFVSTIKDDGKLYLYMSMVAKLKIAQEYTYHIRLTSNKQTINYLGRVISCREPEEQVIRNNECLCIDANTARNICTTGSEFACHVTVQHAGPPPPVARRSNRNRYPVVNGFNGNPVAWFIEEDLLDDEEDWMPADIEEGWIGGIDVVYGMAGDTESDCDVSSLAWDFFKLYNY